MVAAGAAYAKRSLCRILRGSFGRRWRGLDIFFLDSCITLTLKALHELLHRTISPFGSTGSFYAMSHARIQRQMNLWKHELPSFTPFYAVKCNPSIQLCSTLGRLGAGFDCASRREISSIYSIDSNLPIIYANPCKRIDDILHSCVKGGVTTTVIDSIEEVDKLQEIGWSGTSLIRIRVEDKGSAMPFSSKFGLDPADTERIVQYARLKDQRISGVSFHVGSGCANPKQYLLAIEQAVQTIKKILAIQGPSPSPMTLDIGGGFSSDASQFASAAHWIRAATSRIDIPLQLIAEPGRFFAATSQDFFVQVIGKKPGKHSWRYTIDDSLYGQFSCIPFDQAQPRWVRIRAPGEEQRRRSPGVLFGRTCDSVDMIAKAQSMEELAVGDWLWFPHMGAYTTVTATEFNGFPQPAVTYIETSPPTPQLPSPLEVDHAAWPTGLSYVSHVKIEHTD